MSLLLFFGGSGEAVARSPLYPSVLVEVQLSGSSGAWTNIAADVFRTPGIEIDRGLPGGGPLDLVSKIGMCRFAVNNSQNNSAGRVGYYSPHHVQRRPGWGLNIPCRVRLTDPATMQTHTVFRGKIDSLMPMPGVLGQRRVEVTAVDWMDEAMRWNITADIEPQVNKRADELVSTIVNAMPIAPTATEYDITLDTFQYALDVSRIGESPALAEFARIAQSGFDFIYCKADGTLAVENRHARLLDTTVSWTIGDDDMALDGGIEVEAVRDDVINTVRTTAHTKLVDEAPSATVYNQVNVIPIEAGATKVLIGPYRDDATGDSIGAFNVQNPVASVDYTGNEVMDGTGTDRTSSLSLALAKGASGARIEVTNNHGGLVYLTAMRLRGCRVMDRATDMREHTNQGSINLYGEHAVSIDMPYQGNGEIAEGAAQYVLLKWGAVL